MNKYKDNVLYKCIKYSLSPIFKFIYKPTIINKNNINYKDKVILAGNHTSILDPVLLMSIFDRQIHFLAKKELFYGLKGIIFKNMGLISVDRSKKDKNVLKNAKYYLDNNLVVCIFPEGTTEKDKYPNLLPFKIGTSKLSNDTNTPILPFKIIGRYKIFRKKVKIVFGDLIYPSNDILSDNKRLYDIINNMRG